MSDPSERTRAGDDARAGPRGLEPQSRAARLRALHSAWELIGPSSALHGAQHIGEIGRLLRDEIDELKRSGLLLRESGLVQEIDARIDAYEAEMRGVALEIPVSELRSMLPAQVTRNRRGMLDLLDLLLGGEADQPGALGHQLGAVDFLITLLCIGGNGAAASQVQDPVTLTPRLHAICNRAATLDVAIQPEIAAEFFDASKGSRTGADPLQRRKTELGAAFFAPRVLRAMLTYNLECLRDLEPPADPEPLSASTTPTGDAGDETSLFDNLVLPQIADAIRRREAGEAPTHSDIDRIAWCLDLGYAEVHERVALLSESIGQPQELTGTVVLVGLLIRSAVVLEDELMAIGISADTLASHWVWELSDLLQDEIQEQLASGDYDGSVKVTKLRARYLSTLAGGERPQPRPRSKARARAKTKGRPSAKPGAPQRSGAPAGARGKSTAAPQQIPKPADRLSGEAERLATEAMAAHQVPVTDGGIASLFSRSSTPRARLAQLLCSVAVLASVAVVALPGGDRARFSSDELERISPYLERGERTGRGSGDAFIGHIGDEWLELDAARQSQTANELVASLRHQGVRQIMIYDDDGQIRIQALGQRPPQVVSNRPSNPRPPAPATSTPSH